MNSFSLITWFLLFFQIQANRFYLFSKLILYVICILFALVINSILLLTELKPNFVIVIFVIVILIIQALSRLLLFVSVLPFIYYSYLFITGLIYAAPHTIIAIFRY